MEMKRLNPLREHSYCNKIIRRTARRMPASMNLETALLSGRGKARGYRVRENTAVATMPPVIRASRNMARRISRAWAGSAGMNRGLSRSGGCAL